MILVAIFAVVSVENCEDFATHIHNSTKTELDGKLSKIQVKFDVF